MSKYYTKKGIKINNPTAYAKTGAPMYKSKISKVDINAPTSIYKLNLEKGKKYVGKTTNIDRRMEQHFSGGGAKVTQKFKPINGKIIDECPGFFSDKVEQKHTDKNIKKYGYNNVRGGKYVNSKTLNDNSNQNKTNQNKTSHYKTNQYKTNKQITCFKCGKIGHYANQCYSSKSSKTR